MQTIYIHPDNPQERLITKAADALKNDKLIIYPSETGYAFGLALTAKNALEQLKRIRQLDDKHQFTLLCQDLSEIATYAVVDNHQYRKLKSHTPSATTFILDATKDTPKKFAHPKKKTIGIRVPAHPVAQALLQTLDAPLLTSSLILPDNDSTFDSSYAIEERLDGLVDVFVHVGDLPIYQSSIVDMTSLPFTLIRQGDNDIGDLLN